MVRPIYKLCDKALWNSAQTVGVFEGAPVDLADGYIHFSTSEQVRETARRHFAGQQDLVLIAFDADNFGPELRWEPSRGGDLFPHLYAKLDPLEALWVEDLPLDKAGHHLFPDRLQKDGLG